MGSPIAYNPALAPYALDVVRTWSEVEAFRQELFLELLGKRTENARDAYLSLESEQAKAKCVRAVAEQSLSGRALESFRKTQRLTTTVQQTRNMICRWNWGYSPVVEDAFLLVDPTARTPNGALRRNLIFVFTKDDFVAATKANEKVAGFYHALSRIAAGPRTDEIRALEDELEADLQRFSVEDAKELTASGELPA